MEKLQHIEDHNHRHKHLHHHAGPDNKDKNYSKNKKLALDKSNIKKSQRGYNNNVKAYMNSHNIKTMSQVAGLEDSEYNAEYIDEVVNYFDFQ